MYTIDHILSEIKASIYSFKVLFEDNNLSEMSYELGRIRAYCMILEDMVKSKICKSSESSRGENHNV